MIMMIDDKENLRLVLMHMLNEPVSDDERFELFSRFKHFSKSIRRPDYSGYSMEMQDALGNIFGLRQKVGR